MITVYDNLLSSLFNHTDSFILTIFLIVLTNSLITKTIEIYFKSRTKFIRDFNDYIESKEVELKNTGSNKIDFRNSLYEIHEKYNYSPFYRLVDILPFLIQIPFLLSVYFSILKFESFQNLSFLFIGDLSSPDGILNGYNLLPCIMFLVNLIIVKLENKSVLLKDLLFPFLYLILLYEMPSALIIYWTFSLIFNYSLPAIVFKKKIYSFYTVILTPYFLIKIESIYDILNILFFLSLIFLFENLIKNRIKKLKYILIPIIFGSFYVWFFQDLSILTLKELNLVFNDQPVANLWRIHYSLFLILVLSFLVSIFSIKSIKTVFIIWIIVLLLSSNNINSGYNTIPSKAQVSLKQKSKTNSLVLIILDEYSSPSELKNYLPENDLNYFTNYLIKNNWDVKENFKTNELSTSRSIYSLFNYNITGSEFFKQKAQSEIYTNFLGKEVYENSLLIEDLRSKNIKMESYGHFDFNINREDGFYTRYALDEANTFMYLDKFSGLLSFLNNNIFFYDVFSKTLLERINNRYKLQAYSYSVFDYFTKEIIKNNDFVYYHFEMPHGPFRFKNEFKLNGASTDQYAKFWKFTNNKFMKYLSDLNLENDKIIIIGDHGFRSNTLMNPYNSFGAFYGFKEEDLNEVKTVQDVGMLIKKYLVDINKIETNY
mgnify:CR=1 FL=1|tara:strand:+ start:11936 stop:13903 length:1968 start_codon:yes stop_codon:yes gene_type:complete